MLFFLTQRRKDAKVAKVLAKKRKTETPTSPSLSPSSAEHSYSTSSATPPPPSPSSSIPSTVSAPPPSPSLSSVRSTSASKNSLPSTHSIKPKFVLIKPTLVLEYKIRALVEEAKGNLNKKNQEGAESATYSLLEAKDLVEDLKEFKKTINDEITIKKLNRKIDNLNHLIKSVKINTTKNVKKSELERALKEIENKNNPSAVQNKTASEKTISDWIVYKTKKYFFTTDIDNKKQRANDIKEVLQRLSQQGNFDSVFEKLSQNEQSIIDRFCYEEKVILSQKAEQAEISPSSSIEKAANRHEKTLQKRELLTVISRIRDYATLLSEEKKSNEQEESATAIKEATAKMKSELKQALRKFTCKKQEMPETWKSKFDTLTEREKEITDDLFKEIEEGQPQLKATEKPTKSEPLTTEKKAKDEQQIPKTETAESQPVTKVKAVENRKAHRVIRELYSTECTYRQQIASFQTFLDNLLSKKLISEEQYTLLSKHSLLKVQDELLSSLSPELTDEEILEVYEKKMVDYCKAHTEVIVNQEINRRIIEQLEEKYKDNPDYQKIVNELKKSTNNLTPDSCNITAAQRPPRFVLLLGEIIKCAPDESIIKQKASDMLGPIGTQTKAINEAMNYPPRWRGLLP